MGRPGLDPGTLGVMLEHSGPSLNIQICWSIEMGRSLTFFEMHPSLISWIDDWLDDSSHTGQAKVRFKTIDEIQLGISAD